MMDDTTPTINLSFINLAEKDTLQGKNKAVPWCEE
jgi:hypothetical protein